MLLSSNKITLLEVISERFVYNGGTNQLLVCTHVFPLPTKGTQPSDTTCRKAFHFCMQTFVGTRHCTAGDYMCRVRGANIALQLAEMQQQAWLSQAWTKSQCILYYKIHRKALTLSSS